METGELVFTQIGSAENAISAVTEGYRGARVNHIGVAINNLHGTFILEAFPPEVRLTNIAVHFRRSEDENGQPRYMLGRLKQEYSGLINPAINYGIEQRDIPYDHLYITDEAKLYCSELIVDMFKYANNGMEFFKENPMSFINLDTGEVNDYWVKYYAYFGMPVPQGEPGSNPGDISKDEKIDIYKIEGKITGYMNR